MILIYRSKKRRGRDLGLSGSASSSLFARGCSRRLGCLLGCSFRFRGRGRGLSSRASSLLGRGSRSSRCLLGGLGRTPALLGGHLRGSNSLGHFHRGSRRGGLSTLALGSDGSLGRTSPLSGRSRGIFGCGLASLACGTTASSLCHCSLRRVHLDD
ncbi:hypothetical protein PMAYCL1PPCAC_06987 [Pristionchus mayeri]|uniref:Uncharacterized protein n=1 Tax=Pristionchus mayeri TaxID=1317129 RepID=A0AAN4ZFD2_9BILA|nr:hypothetical protein PMAYCL1PPCAC_06987 [Pristionchus mayeri]